MDEIKTKLYNAAREHETASAGLVNLLREARDYAIDAEAAISEALEAQREAEIALAALQDQHEFLSAELASTKAALEENTAYAMGLKNIIADLVEGERVALQDHAYDESMAASEFQRVSNEQMSNYASYAQAARQNLERLEDLTSWKPIDSAPDGKWILAWRELGRDGADGCLELLEFQRTDGNWQKLTHWQAAPEPPKILTKDKRKKDKGK